MLAQEDGRGKKGKCPKCNHLVVVPRTTKGRPAISPNKEPIPEQPKPSVPEWDKGHLWPVPTDELIELCKEDFGFLIPTYDKLSLLLMAVTLILLFVTNIEMRDYIRDFIHGFHAEPYKYRLPLIFYSILICLICLFLYVYRTITSYIIASKEETDFKKKTMLFFAVLINSIIAIIAGTYVLKNATIHDWLLVFPVWNIINCVLLLLMLFFNIIDEECISDRKATPVQIILGLTAVLIIFVLCNYVFKLYWAITFSICIIYTTSFDRALQNVFPGLHKGDYSSEEPVDI
jgi:hypothetical protein